MVPEAFTPNGKLNVEHLQTLLGTGVVDSSEAYGLTWPGKAAAYHEAQTPAQSWLMPCPQESADWENAPHTFIEGENLEVLKLLQPTHAGKVKAIYIDPPYNTGSDSFIYADRFAETRKAYQHRAGKAKNTSGNGHYHANWLSMMLPRLVLSRNLLREDGLLFVSIDDHEVAQLKLVLDEVYGEENYIDIFCWAKSETPANLSKKSKKVVEYVLCYQKKKSDQTFTGVRKSSPSSNGLLNQTNKLNTLTFPAHHVTTRLPNGPLLKGRYGTKSYTIDLLEDTQVKDGFFIEPVVLRAKFKWTQPKLEAEILKGTKLSIPTAKLSPSYEKLAYPAEVPPNLINAKVGVGTNENASADLEALFGAKVFDFPKPVSLIKYLLGFSDDPDGLFLDFFAGSGATAQAVLEMNQQDQGRRKFICVQLAEPVAASTVAAAQGFSTISEITKKRIELVLSRLAEQHPETPLAGFRFYRQQPA